MDLKDSEPATERNLMSLPSRSNHGLTRCRACRAHIHAAERPSLTVCPFCGENQLGLARSQARGRLIVAGRGGALAAGLLAFTALGCGSETADPPPEPTPAPIVEPAPEPMAPLEPSEPIAQPDPPPEPIPDPVEPEPVDVPVEPEPVRPVRRPQPTRPIVRNPDPPTPVPAYGVAPDDQWDRRRPDDAVRVARYGIAPIRRRTTDPFAD